MTIFSVTVRPDGNLVLNKAEIAIVKRIFSIFLQGICYFISNIPYLSGVVMSAAFALVIMIVAD